MMHSCGAGAKAATSSSCSTGQRSCNTSCKTKQNHDFIAPHSISAFCKLEGGPRHHRTASPNCPLLAIHNSQAQARAETSWRVQIRRHGTLQNGQVQELNFQNSKNITTSTSQAPTPNTIHPGSRLEIFHGRFATLPWHQKDGDMYRCSIYPDFSRTIVMYQQISNICHYQLSTSINYIRQPILA